MDKKEITYGLYVEHTNGDRGDVMSAPYEDHNGVSLVKVLKGPQYAPSWDGAWDLWRLKDIKPVGA